MRAEADAPPDPGLSTIAIGLVVSAVIWVGIVRMLARRTGPHASRAPDPRLAPFGLLAFGLLFVLQLVAGLIVGDRLKDAGAAAQTAALVPIDLLAVAVPLLLARFAARPRIPFGEFGLARSDGALRARDFGFALGIYVAAIPLFFAASALNGWIYSRLGVDPTQSVVKDLLANATARGDFVVIAMIAGVIPLLEELLFRGLLQHALRGFLRPAFAVAITAALFAAAHSTAALPVFVIGLVLGVACEVTGSIWPGVFLHALHNGLQLAYIDHLVK